MAFWLCQGWATTRLHQTRRSSSGSPTLVESATVGTPTRRSVLGGGQLGVRHSHDPFIYFLDTRTQRGPKNDPGSDNRPRHTSRASSRGTHAGEAPADAPAPGAERAVRPCRGGAGVRIRVDRLLPAGAGVLHNEYKYDFESWAANEKQMAHVLRVLAGRNVVLLSGDVHYGYTSTVSYNVFDSRNLHGSPVMPSPTGTLQSVPRGRSRRTVRWPPVGSCS